MKKCLVTIQLLIWFSIIATAQIENIDLNKYKQNYFRYGRLGTNLTLNGSNSNNSNEWNNLESKSEYKSLNTNINLNYSLNISNRNYVGYHSISGGYTYNFTNSTNSNGSNPSSEFESKLTNYQLNLFTSNSFYLNEMLFWGLELNSLTSQQNNKRNNTDPDIIAQKDYSFSTRNRLLVQIGYGRIENVTDARQAIYILDDLNKKNRLTHEPTPDEAFEFADFITTVLNKRIIDSREKRIYEYTLIDSFLVSKGLISKSDGKYFGVLSDNWNYARTQSWLKGNKLYLGIISGLNHRNQFHKSTYEYNPYMNERYTHELMDKSIGLEIGGEANWIRGLKWISHFDGKLSIFKDYLDPYYSDYYGDEPKENLNFLESKINYSISYVPNTRTVLTGNAGCYYDYYKDYNDEIVTYVSPYSRISCTYYFSQKLNVNAYTQVNYNKQKRETDTGDAHQKSTSIFFGINLNYYFF